MDAVALVGPEHAAGGHFDLATADAAQGRDAIEQFGAPADQCVGLALLGDVLQQPGHAVDAPCRIVFGMHPDPQVDAGGFHRPGRQHELESVRLAFAVQPPPCRPHLGAGVAVEQVQPATAGGQLARRPADGGMQFVGPGKAGAIALPGPGAEPRDALQLAQLRLLFLYVGARQILRADADADAGHAQRMAVGRPRHHLAVIVNELPAAIGPAHAHAAGIGHGGVLQVRLQCGTLRGAVARMGPLQPFLHGIDGDAGAGLPFQMGQQVGRHVPLPDAVPCVMQQFRPAPVRQGSGRSDAIDISADRSVLRTRRAQETIQALLAGGYRTGQQPFTGDPVAQPQQRLAMAQQPARQVQRTGRGIGGQRMALRIEQHDRPLQRVAHHARNHALIHALPLQ